MARGQVVSIPSGTHQQIFVPSGAQYPAMSVLNPNDGVVYLAENQDCIGTSVGMWDYKIPSQSYAALPGPYLSAGLYYLDQSGSGAAGQITLYPLPQNIPYPVFNAIGRALQTIGTALDITEGSQPQNPGSGILRLWADGSDVLHGLNGAGVDEQFLSSRTDLTPFIATGAVTGLIGNYLNTSSFTTGGVVNTWLETDVRCNISGGVGGPFVLVTYSVPIAASLAGATIQVGFGFNGTVTYPLFYANAPANGYGLTASGSLIVGFGTASRASIFINTNTGTLGIVNTFYSTLSVLELRK